MRLLHSLACTPFSQSSHPLDLIATPRLDDSKRTEPPRHVLPDRQGLQVIKQSDMEDFAKGQRRRTRQTTLPRYCVTALQEPWQSKPTVMSSTAPDYQVTRQSITMEEVASIPRDTQAEPVVSKELLIYKQWTLGIRNEAEQVWLGVQLDVPSSLASKLSSTRLPVFMSDLTRIVWLDRVNPNTLHYGRKLLAMIVRNAQSIFPSIEDPFLKKYFAMLGYINHDVELRSRKRVKLLGFSQNQVLITDAGKMSLIEGVDIVRAISSFSCAAGTREGDDDRNAAELQAQSKAIRDRPNSE